MWRGHLLRLRRISLSQPNRQQHHGADGKKLALPVLKRLEPEARRRQILAHRSGGFTVQASLLVVVTQAAVCVPAKRNRKQQKERGGERMPIELEYPAA